MKPKFFVWLMPLCFLSLSLIIKQRKITPHTYYLNSTAGNDNNDGLSPKTAWKSLDKANQRPLEAGDKLLLCGGQIFYGSLKINGTGTASQPITISAYFESNSQKLPLIDAKGHLAAIHINNSTHLVVSNLELTADAGEVIETEATKKRYGIFVQANKEGNYDQLLFQKIHIHDIFSSQNSDADGANKTSNLGMGIVIQMNNEKAQISNVTIEQCTIERTGNAGIRVNGATQKETGKPIFLQNLNILNNHLKHIGGPGMVPAKCENVVVRSNEVEFTGSSFDPRTHGRGSGIWPFQCRNVLIEKNSFKHARGGGDSCGAHIDFNCQNVVVQYNLSMDNEGGFVEILGNDHNCCYRYNISINDGARIKGQNKAHQDGKILWTSGYVGTGKKKVGPFNSYIYNNTIYVKDDIRACFSFTPTTQGVLIANNIFYIKGKTADVSDDQDKAKIDTSQVIKNVVFKNNLFLNENILPKTLKIKDTAPLFGNPFFKNEGGCNPSDYIPQNKALVKNKSIAIEPILNDTVGLMLGLKVKKDYLGNPIKNIPDLGAIEIK